MTNGASRDGDPERLRPIGLIGYGVDVMFAAIEPVGNMITAPPAGPSHPRLNAGPGFHFFRTLHTLPHREAVLAEIADGFDGLRHKLADAMESTD